METAAIISGLVTLGLGVFSFLAKQQFQDIKKGIEDTKEQILENNNRINERVDKLEEKTNVRIGDIKKELSDIKGDFATTFVLREDFFRSMNGVEEKMKQIDNKLDKLLMK